MKSPLEWISAIFAPWRELSSLINNCTHLKVTWLKVGVVCDLMKNSRTQFHRSFRVKSEEKGWYIGTLQQKSLAESDRGSSYQKDALTKRERTRHKTKDPRYFLWDELKEGLDTPGLSVVDGKIPKENLSRAAVCRFSGDNIQILEELPPQQGIGSNWIVRWFILTLRTTIIFLSISRKSGRFFWRELCHAAAFLSHGACYAS